MPGEWQPAGGQKLAESAAAAMDGRDAEPGALAEPGAPGEAPCGYHSIHPDASLNFQCNRWLEAIGPQALAEISEAVANVRDYAQWIASFLALAERARAEGRPRAAAYYDRSAEFFMSPGDPRRPAARARFLEQVRGEYPVAPTFVPYQGSRLYAYDLVPDGLARDVLVIFGGFDGYLEDSFPRLASLRAAGYRVVAFEGPGQGSTLHEGGLPMTAEWERPVGAVLDHFELAGVTAIGVSLGGCLVLRAAAFEPRIARAISYNVLDDMLEVMGAQVAGPLGVPLAGVMRLALACRADRLLDLAMPLAAARRPVTQWGLRQGMQIAGTSRPSEYLRLAAALNTRHISGRVRADVLLLAGAQDHFVPLRQLHRQAAALTAARSVTTRVFGPAEQAASHIQVGNQRLAVRTMLAWVDAMRAAG